MWRWRELWFAGVSALGGTVSSFQDGVDMRVETSMKYHFHYRSNLLEAENVISDLVIRSVIINNPPCILKNKVINHNRTSTSHLPENVFGSENRPRHEVGSWWKKAGTPCMVTPFCQLRHSEKCLPFMFWHSLDHYPSH